MPMKLSDRETTATKSQPGSYGSFGVGVEDIVILPLVAIAVIVKVVLRALLTILIDIIDWVFPILLQVMRFPLFTIRILGDGIAALLKGAMRFLPIGNIRRQAWQGFISRNWAWCRQSLSYRAFEEWLHHAFEDGMAWVFRKCRSLTPPAALLVIIGAALWLPISFGVATLMHAVLLAKAASLPSWMQLLHPVATVIAKSKLLVLPAYPAAWPQAKRHPVVQAMITFWRHLTTLYLMRKIGYRYRQTEFGDRRGGGLRLRRPGYRREPPSWSATGGVQCHRGGDRARTEGARGGDGCRALGAPAVQRHCPALQGAPRRGEPPAICAIQRQSDRLLRALVDQILVGVL